MPEETLKLLLKAAEIVSDVLTFLRDKMNGRKKEDDKREQKRNEKSRALKVLRALITIWIIAPGSGIENPRFRGNMSPQLMA